MTRVTSLQAKILRRAESLRTWGTAALLSRSRELCWQARSMRNLSSLLPEVFALGIEASRRAIGLVHYPVQVQGGIEIFSGKIVEMQTGEGKTVTAVLPVILRAMAGRGCHVVTANEYLAKRDAELMGPVYRMLGLSVGCVHAEMDDEARREAYAKDITYGTASEIGFDFLRDRLRSGTEMGTGSRRELFADRRAAGHVQRGQYFALIDEADSILIDEAKTPLIIGMEQANRSAMVSLYRWSFSILRQLRPSVDFVLELKKRQAHLTDLGCRKVSLLAKPVILDSIDTERIYQHVERSLTAQYGFTRDKDYVVREEEIAIVDEGTGRILEGRQWQAGLHQAIEAKENLPISPITVSAARITIQTLFRHYKHLAGMTGTAAQAKRELKKIYRLNVAVIPTHRPCLRKGFPVRVFLSLEAKRIAVAQEVHQLTANGRSVLIGTPSVEASEALSRTFESKGISHVVLNARAHEQEAEIVAEAGQPGRVTIATNMAGRGTDIHLAESVRDAGGLHVIATEMHTSSRIDRQLIGRAARQGDPGSFQFFLSLEDELLRVLTPKERQRHIDRARPNADGELSHDMARIFRGTQRQLERLHAKLRKQLLKSEKEQFKKARRIGLDPFLELVDE